MGYSSKDVAQRRLHFINVEVKPTASVIVFPDFYFRVYQKCVIKASLISYSVRVELRDEKGS